MPSFLDMLAGQAMQGAENPLAPRTQPGAPTVLGPILQPHPYEASMQPLIDHHNSNVLRGKTTLNPDGSISSIKTITFGGNGEPYMVIPSIWDGADLSDKPREALKKAMASGVKWPTFQTQAEADAADALLHRRWKK